MGRIPISGSDSDSEAETEIAEIMGLELAENNEGNCAHCGNQIEDERDIIWMGGIEPENILDGRGKVPQLAMKTCSHCHRRYIAPDLQEKK